jgi:hypothetical protein
MRADRCQQSHQLHHPPPEQPPDRAGLQQHLRWRGLCLLFCSISLALQILFLLGIFRGSTLTNGIVDRFFALVTRCKSPPHPEITSFPAPLSPPPPHPPNPSPPRLLHLSHPHLMYLPPQHLPSLPIRFCPPPHLLHLHLPRAIAPKMMKTMRISLSAMSSKYPAHPRSCTPEARWLTQRPHLVYTP